MKKINLLMLVLAFALACGGKEKTPPAGELVDSTLAVRYYGADGKTVLELLEASHEVEKKTSSLGSFVEAIDGVANRRDRFWLYYVNGKKSEVASDRYTTAAKDTIEWRFEKSYKEEK
ncbi:MAG: DUF4430 domain-containing protein [candidate division Zixibacteria bacterium]|nr:DUF4430 domain-containing protein [candidate division Zixibacteria bacterium]